jgi:hypothetical protein
MSKVMNEPLYRTLIVILAWLQPILVVPAIGSTAWTYFAYSMMTEPLGWGLLGRFIALIGAIMAGVLYWAGGTMLITLVPRFGAIARLLAIPAIVTFMGLVVASSSYPQVMLFHGPAREAETAAYTGEAAAFTDAVKAASAEAKGLQPVLGDMASRIERLAELELNGTLSGVPSAGTVHATLKALAADVGQTRDGVASGAAQAAASIVKLDSTLGDMRQAAQNKALGIDDRRQKFESQSDGLRTASIALSRAIPLEAVSALSARLQGSLIKPAATGAKQTVRAMQTEALLKIESELQTIGKDLDARLQKIVAALKITPPIYAPQSAGELVISHWRVLINAWAVSLSVDLFIILLLWLACIAHDEAKRQAKLPDERPHWVLEAEKAFEATREFQELMARPADDLGPVPYPNATKTRADTRTNARKNGSFRPGDGDPQ